MSMANRRSLAAADARREARRAARERIPWRTIVGAIVAVVGTLIGLLVIRELARIIAWIVVGVFFAVVLQPLVDLVERRLHLRRSAAISLVFFLSLAVVLGLLALFIVPVAKQAPSAISDLPNTVHAASQGRGPIGQLVTRFHLENTVRNNEPRIQDAIRNLESSSVGMLRSVFNTLLGLVTILVLTFLFLTEGPAICRFLRDISPARHRDRVTSVATESAKAVSGYMLGNLVISVVAGLATYVVLLILRVPNAALLALWVAFADLIPLIGATLGAVAVVLAALIHSPVAGIVAIIFFVVYQQFENHVLSVAVMARTVKVPPLVVLLSALIGVELFGFVGAFLAVPVAGVLQTVVLAVWSYRHDDDVVTEEPAEVVEEAAG